MDIFFPHNKEKRKSWTDKVHSNKSSPRLASSKPTKLDIVFESPPLIFKGSQSQSTGALFSGQLRLITDVEVDLESLQMRLLAEVTSKKPVHNCPDCQVKTTEIFKWNMLSEPTKFAKGTHSFPFSYLLPGHLTATTRSHLGNINYSLLARADSRLPDSRLLDGRRDSKPPDPITATASVDVKRALVPPEVDRTSMRIFPPTNLKAEVMHPPLVYPIGNFNVQLRLTGLVMSDSRFRHRWRLRKTLWRIDEHTKWVSPACTKHAVKLGGEGKGILHNETRHLGSDDLKKGWKSESSEGEGSVEMEFTCALSHRPVCDFENPAGMEVDHRLCLELIVSKTP